MSKCEIKRPPVFRNKWTHKIFVNSYVWWGLQTHKIISFQPYWLMQQCFNFTFILYSCYWDRDIIYIYYFSIVSPRNKWFGDTLLPVFRASDISCFFIWTVRWSSLVNRWTNRKTISGKGKLQQTQLNVHNKTAVVHQKIH